jgi:serine/threonine protein kinase
MVLTAALGSRAMSFSSGENIGAYRILEQLGTGGMATVFKAYHAALDRFVAIKVIHPAFKGDADFLKRFQREARVVAKLDHPNIVQVYDFSEHDGSPYLVMRFVEGETLKARLTRGHLTLPEILDVIRPMGEGLNYAHEQGVLHRDIKPSNVLLRNDARVFLTDFGLARIVESGESSLTRDAVIGTPNYISPEQAMGKSELDARTDIYSFGIVLYELFAGRVPFQSDTPFAVIHDHIYSPLPMPRSINPNMPPELEQVLLKALAKNPNDRFSTAHELVSAVEHAVRGVPAGPAPRLTAAQPATAAEEAAVASRRQTMPKSDPQPVARPVAPPTTPPSPAADRQRSRRRWLPIAAGVVLLALVATFAVVLLALTGGEELGNGADVPAAAEPSAGESLPDPKAPDEDVGALIRRGNELAAQGDIDGALSAFERATELDPGATPAYLEAARVLFEVGEPDAAIGVLRRGVAANEGDIDLRLILLQELVAADRWDEAVGEIDWFFQHAPDVAAPHAYLSVHLAINENDLDGARHHAAEALRLQPDSAEGHFALGVFHWKAGDYRQARLELERARRSPGVSPMLRERIQLFLERIEQSETNP